MRASLKQSLKDTPAGHFERYPKGSTVLCNACSLPIFKLDHGIAFGDKGGQMARAFKPLTARDLETLEARDDIDAGVVAALKLLPAEKRLAIVEGHEPKSGDPMVCPVCHGTFVQVLSVEKNEVLDKAYVLELLTLPPQGQPGVAVRGLSLGADKGWIHEHAELI